MTRRNTIAGCKKTDLAAQALGEILEIFSRGRRFVENPLSGVRGIAWKAQKGGWVVHNEAWAIWGGMPRRIFGAAVEALRLKDPLIKDPDEEIRATAVRSFHASRDTLWGVYLEDGRKVLLLEGETDVRIGELFDGSRVEAYGLLSDLEEQGEV